MFFGRYKQIQQHPEGRLFAIGDVHGCLGALQVLLTQIQFDSQVDQVIFLGDLADRGKQNLETFDFVLDKPYFHLVAGNHEDLLVAAYSDNVQVPKEMLDYWHSDDGNWTQSVDDKTLQNIITRLGQQAYFIFEAQTNTGKTFGLTHAGYDDARWFNPNNNYDYSYFRKLMWSRQRAESIGHGLEPVSGIDYTVHGHTIFREPMLDGNAIFIDTGKCCGGKLTALDLDKFVLTGSLAKSIHQSL